MKNENLAQGVKNLRKRNGLSQEDLAFKSGLSLRTIQRVENGESEPTGETIKRISHTLGITPNEFVDLYSNKVTLKMSIKTKDEYLHIFDNKLLITKTEEINDLVEDFGKSVNNMFKSLMVIFISIPIFTTLSVIFYNIDMKGLAIFSGSFAFCFLDVAFYTMLFTSGSSEIKIGNITLIRIQKKLRNYVVLISHKESGRLKVRALVLKENQVDIMRNTLISEKLMEEKNIKMKGTNDYNYLFLIAVFFISSQFSKLFLKGVDPVMINGFIILFVSILFLISIMFKLINPLCERQKTAPI